jgi:hypothetical protein
MADQENINSAKALKQELEEILFLQRSFTDEALKSAKAVFGVSEQSKATSKAFRGVSNITADIQYDLTQILKGEKGLTDLLKTQQKQKRHIATLDSELVNAAQSITNLSKEQIGNIVKEESLTGKLKLLADARLESRDKLTESEDKLLGLYQDQLETLVLQEDQVKEIERIQESLGTIPDLGEGVENILGKFGFGDFAKRLGFGEAKKEAEKLALSTNGGASKLQLAGKYAITLGKNLAKSLGPLFFIQQFIEGIMQADKETVELQKSMALTRGEAMGFRTELASAAASSGDINITSTKLLETFSSLNKQFGFITNFATDTLVTMTKLTKVVGIGAESAGNLAAASSLTGDSFEDNYKDVLATSYELQRQSGVQMDLRDILEQSGKVTGTVRANLGANPSLIAKAITQAKLFGASLEDVANAGKALLNFESSIEAELQAELLLGRNLNLERARAAALAGDQVTLAEELQKQAGNFEEFTSMNVIQQEALASAMGMQSDQLADILFQQEIQGKTARELRAAGKEELAQRLEAQTLADKFNATVDKLKGIFTDVGTAFMPILQVFGAALSLVGAIVGLVGDLFKMLGGDFSFSGFTSGLEGVVGALGFSTADDAIIPAGYGETIIKKGKDTIALNNEDSVVAGTNLGGGGTDMKETNQLLKMLVTQNKEKPQISPVGLYQVQ